MTADTRDIRGHRVKVKRALRTLAMSLAGVEEKCVIKHNQPMLTVQMTGNQGSSNDTAVDAYHTIAQVKATY